MQIIEQEFTNHHSLKTIVFSAHRALGSLSNSPSQYPAASPSTQKYVYIRQIYLPKIGQFVTVSWQCTFSLRTIYTNLSIDHSFGTNPVSQGLSQFFKNNASEIGDYIFRLNNLQLSEKEGIFILNSKTGQLSYRASITGFFFISTSFKIETFLRVKFMSMTKTFAVHLENIIFYYKLFGFDLLDRQTELQQGNHVPLRQKVEKIMMLRELFECDRTNRSKRSRINLKSGLNKSVEQLMNFLSDRSKLQRDHIDYRTAFSTSSIMRMKEQYEAEQQKILNRFSSLQERRNEGVLTSIVITQKVRQKKITKGGFGSIYYGIYNYIPQASIFQIANTEESNELENYEEIKGCGLVRKTGHREAVENIALQNECAFLIYIRNKVCPFFAKYFCNKSTTPFENGEIYLEYYPTTLGHCKLREEDKINVVMDVCLGLLFLAQENILHRDLKEFNIMVDSQKRGRLIDFGSVSNVYTKNNFKAKDNKLRSTEGYYLPYSVVLKRYPNIQNVMSQGEYYTHRTFDLYSLGKILHNIFYLDGVVESHHFFRHHLKFLSQRCMELNPEDRWTIEQVIIFLQNLMEFEQLRKQFWSEWFRINGNLAKHYANVYGGSSSRIIGGRAL